MYRREHLVYEVRHVDIPKKFNRQPFVDAVEVKHVRRLIPSEF